MLRQKTNNGPCSVHNCDKNSYSFRCLTKLAMNKALVKGIIQQYPYLQTGQQVCNAHYMAFVIENERTEHEKAPIPSLSVKLLLGDCIKKMTTVLYKKRQDDLVLDPNEFEKMLEDADSNLKGFFAEMCDILIPYDRSAYSKNEDKKKVVTILHLMAGLRNKHVNAFKLELGLYLAGSGTTSDAINVLSNAGISAAYKTVYKYKKKVADEHSIRVKKYFNDSKGQLRIYNLDDYHNVREDRRPDNTSLSEAVHFATSVCKKVERSNSVPIIFNGISVHNPSNVDASLICEKLIEQYQKYFDLSYSQRKAQWTSNLLEFDRIDQLTIHTYDDAIAERKEERRMKNTILVGMQEQQLHSVQDYLNALNMILDYNKETNCLTNNVAPIVADWPGQLYIRKAITHLQNGNKNSLVQPEVISFVPLLGPLHVSLNTREHTMKIYYLFFKKLFHDVFGKRKILAKKPRPWRTTLLLELAFSAWIKIKEDVTKKFTYLQKNIEYQVITELLDNIVPAALDVYASLFRSGVFDNYVETIFRIWTFALRWKRKNYNKAPLAFLSDIFYWEKNGHPMREAIEKNLVQFNDYWVENMHSRIRATTSPHDSAENIRRQVYTLDYHKHSAFREMFSTTNRYPYSPQDLKFLTNKTCLFLLSQFREIYKKNEETILISNQISSLKKRQTKKDLRTIYDLPTLGKLDTTSMPTGYSTPPLSDGCDYCHVKLIVNEGIILICGHGYHIGCYNRMDNKCEPCLNYYKDGISKNVKSFLKCLNTETNEPIDELREPNDTVDEADSDEEDGQLEIDEDLELDLRSKINEMVKKIDYSSIKLSISILEPS